MALWTLSDLTGTKSPPKKTEAPTANHHNGLVGEMSSKPDLVLVGMGRDETTHSSPATRSVFTSDTQQQEKTTDRPLPERELLLLNAVRFTTAATT